MTATVAEAPPDVDQNTTTPDTLSLPETAQALHTKPAGITEKTWQSLRTKQKRFVAFYAENPNAVSAYVAAGYNTTRDGREQPAIARNAYNVRRGQKITQALAEQKQHVGQRAQDRKDRNLDWIVAELDRLKELAEGKGDMAVAVRAVELIGKTRGVFVDTTVVDVAARREYSKQERIETLRLSRYLLEHDDGAEAEAIEESERERGGDGKFVAGENDGTTEAPRARSSL